LSIILTRTRTGAGHLMIFEAGPVYESGWFTSAGIPVRAYIYLSVDR